MEHLGQHPVEWSIAAVIVTISSWMPGPSSLLHPLCHDLELGCCRVLLHFPQKSDHE